MAQNQEDDSSMATDTAEPDRRSDADVIIVGCGPVGMTLAILLAQLDRSVILLERWPEPYPLPRAVHFDHEIGRILQACGIGSQVKATTQPAEIYEWQSAAGATLLRFGRIGNGASGWPESSMFNQPELEAILEQRLTEFDNVEIRRGVEVTGISQTDSKVTAHLVDGPKVSGSYLVGCDGANSTVRGSADLTVTDLGFFYDWLIVDVVLNEPRVFDPLNLQVCDPDRPTTAVAAGPGRRRWEFMRLPNESREQLEHEQRAWELLETWDVNPSNAKLERHAVYTFNARYTNQWRSGRVLIAGDAAHLMPPFAGQGMCAGIRDSANLAWKLNAVLAGNATQDLLNTYQEERLPHAKRTIEFSMELGKIICVPDHDEAATRDEAMASTVGTELSEVPPMPGFDTGLVDEAAPGSGQLFIQGTVNGQPFDDTYGAGWRLLHIAVSLSESGLSSESTSTDQPADKIDPEVQEWFESIGGKVTVLSDPDENYCRWLDKYETPWILQRPDFYLFGGATSAEGANQLLTNLQSALTGL